jgi:probable DNA metabolism protein
MRESLYPLPLSRYLYDGTYEGLLSAIFESYRLKVQAAGFQAEDTFSEGLFESPIQVATNLEHAERVRQGVIRKTSLQAAQMLYRCFLSEQTGIELLIYNFVKMAMASTENIEDNYGDATILKLHQINKQIGREVHRMHAFVRFQRTADNLYYAVIEPDFNVLPLLGEHFEKRYPAQSWIIYDSRRHYGIFYNQEKVEYVTFDVDNHRKLQQLSKDILQTEEEDYQTLWKDYYTSVNIPERRNLKVHLQHVPKRYWKYLTEKF